MANPNVFLFIPNIIGYIRLLLLLVAAATASNGMPISFFASYSLSQILDAADGAAARHYGQASVFGACLDQLLDRLSTCLLYILLAVYYPIYAAGAFLLLLADVGGHWLHFFAAATAGAKTHKEIDPNANTLLRLYYHTRGLMLACIVGYEGFLLMAILCANLSPGLMYTCAKLLALACIPAATLKLITNVLQGIYGCRRLAALTTAP